jgi:putative FmdB family regulatory protein
MPMFEYACRKCNHNFETLVFDGERVECPVCQSTRLERLLSVPSKPPSAAQSLPSACDTNLPPCGPACCRLPAS